MTLECLTLVFSLPCSLPKYVIYHFQDEKLLAMIKLLVTSGLDATVRLMHGHINILKSQGRDFSSVSLLQVSVLIHLSFSLLVCRLSIRSLEAEDFRLVVPRGGHSHSPLPVDGEVQDLGRVPAVL